MVRYVAEIFSLPDRQVLLTLTMILQIINTVLIFIILKYLIFYNRYKLNIVYGKDSRGCKSVILWLLKWSYKDSQFYRHKILFKIKL